MEGWQIRKSPEQEAEVWSERLSPDTPGAGCRAEEETRRPGRFSSGLLTEARPSPTIQLLPGFRPRRDSRMRATSSSIGDEEDGGPVAASVTLLPPLPLGGAYGMGAGSSVQYQ